MMTAKNREPCPVGPTSRFPGGPYRKPVDDGVGADQSMRHFPDLVRRGEHHGIPSVQDPIIQLRHLPLEPRRCLANVMRPCGKTENLVKVSTAPLFQPSVAGSGQESVSHSEDHSAHIGEVLSQRQ